jgi:hypothetical protein
VLAKNVSAITHQNDCSILVVMKYFKKKLIDATYLQKINYSKKNSMETIEPSIEACICIFNILLNSLKNFISKTGT